MIYIYVACLIAPFFLFGAPVGNPTLPFLLQEGCVIPDTVWCNPQCGFTGDYLFQKRFRTCHASKQYEVSKAILSGPSEMAALTWSIRERLNIQLNLGSGQYSFQWIQQGQMVSGAMRGGFMWGGDVKLIILNIRDTVFAIDGQAGGFDWMEGFATMNGSFSSAKASSLLRYWQAAVALTQNISFFSPYLGFAANRSRMKVSHAGIGTGRFHTRHPYGPFGGCSLSYGNQLLLNIEWRGWFEEGISVAGQLRF